MKNLVIAATVDSPLVEFDTEKGLLCLTGRSYMNDSSEFYTRILEWIIEYCKHERKNTILEFKLDYFNSSTNKYLIEIIMYLEKHTSDLSIKWFYKSGDNDLQDIGIELQSLFDAKFLIVEY